MVDRGRVGAGTSALSMGGIRGQFIQPTNILLAARTIEQVSTFRQEHGEEVAHRQLGYLMLYATEQDEAVLRRNIAIQNSHGVDTRLVGPEQVAEMVPGMRTDDLRGAAYGPQDGYVDPRTLVAAYGRAAVRHGCTILEGQEITWVRVIGDRVVSVGSAGEQFAPGIVVNAAGAWSSRLASLYGSTLPIKIYRAQQYILDSPLQAGKLTPLVLDRINAIRFHSEGRGIMFGGGEAVPFSDGSWTASPDLTLLPQVRECLVNRLPETKKSEVIHSWAGIVEFTEDFNPIVGWSHPENVYTVAAFSGHGMSLAPGLAVEAAKEICGETSELDLSLYRMDRFVSGEPLRMEHTWTAARKAEAGRP